MPGSDTQPQAASSAQLDAIDDRDRIVSLIQRVVSERLFVSVALSDGHEDYNSTILGVEPDRGTFLLDAVYPDEGNSVLRQEGWLRVTARFNGASLTFASRADGEDEAAGFRFFRVNLPERVDYAQRRGRYRVPVEALADVEVTLENADGKALPGVLHDISGSGLSVRLAAGAPAVAVGDTIPCCVVRLPDDEPIVARIEVRDVREDPQGVLFGACFVELERMFEQRIERFVAAMERQMLKQRNGA